MQKFQARQPPDVYQAGVRHPWALQEKILETGEGHEMDQVGVGDAVWSLAIERDNPDDPVERVALD